jgi:hypothetical protein
MSLNMSDMFTNDLVIKLEENPRGTGSTVTLAATTSTNPYPQAYFNTPNLPVGAGGAPEGLRPYKRVREQFEQGYDHFTVNTNVLTLDDSLGPDGDELQNYISFLE